MITAAQQQILAALPETLYAMMDEDICSLKVSPTMLARYTCQDWGLSSWVLDVISPTSGLVTVGTYCLEDAVEAYRLLATVSNLRQ